jgi:hypothetical protein
MWQNVVVGSKPRAPKPVGDVAIVCGKDENGVHILRRRSEDAPIEAGIAQPLAEGKPITGEVISMRPRKDLPFLFDVTTEVEGSPRPDAEPSATDGPAQVATDSYRKGWDAIWGRKRRSPSPRDVN